MDKHLFFSLFLALGGIAGCAPAGIDSGESGGENANGLGAHAPLPDVTCAGEPDAGPTIAWQHSFHAEETKVLGLGIANHRGVDTVATASSDPQMVKGELRYGLKSLENENVTLFACLDGAWQTIGNATSGDDGNFELDLTVDDSGVDHRLPVGIRSMYLSVDGDRTGADFVAVVAPDARTVAFSDVDGTLTSSENAAAAGLIGLDVEANPGAADALNVLAQKGYPIVYVTAMARTFTQNRRAWLAAKGFPRGALRLADGITLPGAASVTYKTTTFDDIAATGLVPTIGVGNRASDATAYGSVGIDGAKTFLKLGQFDSEDDPVIAAGNAVGVTSYVDALPLFQALPAATP